MTAKPLFSTLRAGLTAGVLAVVLSACGSTNWGFPYRPDVQQGNWITAEQVSQLQQGMTREQVRFILGTPTLQDIFRTDRWDYPYYNKPGYGKEQERKFTVWFEGDALVRWEGDEQPNRQPFEKADTGMTDRDTDKGNAPAAAPESLPANPDVPVPDVSVPGEDTAEPLR
jgi:outer membrane protein assembly factor BamE